MFASLAQLDRVTGYEPVGQGFESLTTRQQRLRTEWCVTFVFLLGTRRVRIKAQTASVQQSGGLFFRTGVRPQTDESLTMRQQRLRTEWCVTFVFC